MTDRQHRVAAHSNAQVVEQVRKAVESALAPAGTNPAQDPQPDDEYTALFPPNAPLGHQVQPTKPKVHTAAADHWALFGTRTYDGPVRSSLTRGRAR